MRAVSLSQGVNMPAVVNAAAEEIESHIKEVGDLDGAFVVVSIRTCIDSEIERGATTQRRLQPL